MLVYILTLLLISNYVESNQRCNQLMQDYHVKPGESWGSLPFNLQNEWQALECDNQYYVIGEVKYYGSKYASKRNSTLLQYQQHNVESKCKILIFDRIIGYLNWYQKWFKDSCLNRCKYPCELTEDHSQISSADIIFYHGPTHTKNNLANNPLALSIFLCMEQPLYVPLMLDYAYLSKFDAVMTYSMSHYYKSSSIINIPITYYPLEVYSPLEIFKPPIPFSQKTGFNSGVSVAVFASNCFAAGAADRSAYILELMKYINVHSYGGCHNNIKEPQLAVDPTVPLFNQRKGRKINILREYKFYLAFENSAEEDYISEKIFDGLIAGTIPIYRGTDSINTALPSPSSIINANNLTAQQLANKLNHLLKYEDEYNKFFSYRGGKRRKIPKEFRLMTLRSFTHPNVVCRLGYFLYTKRINDPASLVD